MGGFKDELDDLDDDLDINEGDDEGEDFSFDEDGGESGENKNSQKKGKNENSGFNRENYYIYKDKLVQLAGTIRPKEKTKEGKILSLDFKTEEKVYSVVMDDMGKKLAGACYQELLVTGLVSKISEKEFTLSIKTYI